MPQIETLLYTRVCRSWFFFLYWLHLEDNDEKLTIGSFGFYFFIEIRSSDEQYDKNDGYDEDDGLSCSENLEEQSEVLVRLRLQQLQKSRED